MIEVRLSVIALPGLSPDSLGNYLASLGLLRVARPGAADGRWSRNAFSNEPTLRAAARRGPYTYVTNPSPEADHEEPELEGSHSTLAQSSRSGETTPQMGKHPALRCGKHGLRAGASGFVDAGRGTRAAAYASRNIETGLGRLTNAKVVPSFARGSPLREGVVEMAARLRRG